MGFFKKLNRSLKSVGMRKGEIKEDVVEEIAKRVAEEDIEEMIEEVIEEDPIPEKGKMKKEEFLISKGLHERPNSHIAIKAWEEYQDSFYDI